MFSEKQIHTLGARERESISGGLPFLRSKANYPRSSSIHISRPVAFALQAFRNLRQLNFHHTVQLIIFAGAPADLGRRA